MLEVMRLLIEWLRKLDLFDRIVMKHPEGLGCFMSFFNRIVDL